MMFWKRLRAWASAPLAHGCQFVTGDDWGHGNWWYCTTHERWYPEQVFMRPPKCCKEFEPLPAPPLAHEETK